MQRGTTYHRLLFVTALAAVEWARARVPVHQSRRLATAAQAAPAATTAGGARGAARPVDLHEFHALRAAGAGAGACADAGVGASAGACAG